jgi:hypothetical protein
MNVPEGWKLLQLLLRLDRRVYMGKWAITEWRTLA